MAVFHDLVIWDLLVLIYDDGSSFCGFCSDGIARKLLGYFAKQPLLFSCSIFAFWFYLLLLEITGFRYCVCGVCLLSKNKIGWDCLKIVGVFC